MRQGLAKHVASGSSPGGSLARVREQADGIADLVLDSLHERVPRYSAKLRADLNSTVRDVVHQALLVAIDSYDTRSVPSPEDLAPLRAAAAARAHQQVPLEAVLRDYFIGTEILWDTVCDELSDRPALAIELSRWQLRILEAMFGALVSAYLEEHRAVFGADRRARDALMDALVTGAPAQHLSERVGHGLPTHWAVASVAFTPASSGSAAMMRRRVRAIEARLMSCFGPETLTRIDIDEGWVLVSSKRDAEAHDSAQLRDALTALSDLDVGVLAGLAHGASDGLKSAADLARELRLLARRLGREHGVFQLDDLLLEHALSQSSASAERLRKLLVPIEQKPDLVDSLEAWFDTGFRRQEAAAHLHIHPNTLDYRLRRADELLTVDIRDPEAIPRLAAAFVVRRLGRR